MIDLDKAAQVARGLGWRAYMNKTGESVVYRDGCALGLFANGDVALADVTPLTDIAPLIAAWAELAQEGIDGDGA